MQRFKNGFPISLTPREYVENNAIDEYQEWCKQTAYILKDIGINLNLAPVVDLSSFEKDYHVLNDRSFGDNIETVNNFAKILIDEHSNQNILTCAKHFPGLGSCSIDPHENISNSDKTIENLKNYHWLPFTNAIKNDVDSIMTTHILNKNLDCENISTFSAKTIEILRNELSFDGPILSDDLNMGGAGNSNNIKEISLNALKAGHNLIMISKEIDLQRRAIYCIKESYKRDGDFRLSIERSNGKIERFKNQVLST